MVRPALVWERLLQVVVLLRAWLEPLVELALSVGLSVGRPALLAGLTLLVGALMGIGALVLRRRSGISSRTHSEAPPAFGWRALVWLLLLGLVGVVLAYIPAIFVRRAQPR